MRISDITVVLHERKPTTSASFGPARPVHRLLDTCRDRIPAYFSTAHHKIAAGYAEEAKYWQEQGWKGYKLHPPRGPWLPRDSSPRSTSMHGLSEGGYVQVRGMTWEDGHWVTKAEKP